VSLYASDAAFRVALEQRLASLARSTNVSLDRLRRQVVLERLLARLDAVEPGAWVLKGAMALEVRLGTAARATMDVDLGLRAEEPSAGIDLLTERFTNIFAVSINDRFVFRRRRKASHGRRHRPTRPCSHPKPTRRA
jgi:hypothetical protein